MAIDEVLVVLENPLRNVFAMPQLADFETSWEPWQVLVCDDYVWNTDVDYMPMPRQFYLPRAPSDFCYLYVRTASCSFGPGCRVRLRAPRPAYGAKP